ncbi:MAG TPA: response regulator [Gemmataceae bacterium]|jgi:CheY-like chemotaxis protein|nr:response regulator [Gemmataceae bacterium]
MSAQVRPGKHILLVEDDEITRGAIKLVLEWEGYQVDCAANGQEALDLLRDKEPPSLILLDVMMPVLDGEQFRQEQKRDPRLAQIPVVIVSALDVSSCLEAAGHVQKPFQVEELLAAIRQCG